jgi:hypothetical protein
MNTFVFVTVIEIVKKTKLPLLVRFCRITHYDGVCKINLHSTLKFKDSETFSGRVSHIWLALIKVGD